MKIGLDTMPLFLLDDLLIELRVSERLIKEQWAVVMKGVIHYAHPHKRVLELNWEKISFIEI